MARNGAGVFNRLYNWVNDRDASVPITASRMDAEQDGIATALSESIARDGQTTITANLPMATFKHTGVGASNSRTDYADTGSVQDGSFNYVADTGAADAYVMTLAPAITAYATGAEYAFKVVNASTGASTLNINSVGAKTIKKYNDQDIEANDFEAGGVYVVRYDGTNMQLVSPISREPVFANEAQTFAEAVTFSKTVTFTKGSDIASATALTLGADGNYFDVTGTTTITSIGTVGIGTTIKLHFDGILTLTHHATDLILPGGLDITTKAGDEFEFVEYATGDFRLTGSNRTGRLVQRVEATPNVTYSGTTVLVPFDDTIPQQSTEGSEFVTVAITPTKSTNRLVIKAEAGAVTASSTNTVSMSLYQDSTENALKTSAMSASAANFLQVISLSHEMAAGTTSSTTFKIRMGPDAGTVYVNGTSAGRKYGGTAAVTLSVEEIEV